MASPASNLTISPEIQYQLDHVNDNIQPSIIAACVICLTAAYAAVALRVVARRLQNAPLLADDKCIFFGLFFTSVFVATCFYDVHNGLGRHAILIKNPVVFAKVILASEVLYNPAIAATKFSILLLYRRIFPSRGYHKILLLVGVFVLCYCITAAMVNIFQCVPVQADWDPRFTPRCVNLSVDLIILSSINVVTDFTILCLPMPQLWKLHATKQKKIQVAGMFLLGGFVCIVSIIRATFVSKVSLLDGSWGDSKGALWSVVETCLAVVSACLPTMRPLYSRIVHGDSQFGQSSGVQYVSYESRPKPSSATSKGTKLSTFASSQSQDGYGGHNTSFTRLAEPQPV